MFKPPPLAFSGQAKPGDEDRYEQGGLQREEVIRGADVLEMRRIYTEANDISKELENRGEPEERGLLVKPQPMPNP